MAELVGLIISGWSQSELALLAPLGPVVASECARVLYKSPWIDDLSRVRGDNRLAALASALQRHHPHMNDLGIGCQYYTHPKWDQLGLLFKACVPLGELELAGALGGSGRRSRRARLTF